MDFDLIMEEITHGLTGDFPTDCSYLKEQMEKYKDHEMSKEIIRACGRIMYEIMPEDKKAEISKLMQKEDLRIDSTLEEVRFNIYQKNFEKAENIMEALVSKVDELASTGMYQDDAVSMYFTFSSFFEEILYVTYNKPEKDVRRSDIPYAEVYLQYGSLLVDLKRYEDANAAMAKAVRWNPVNAGIAFEYAETFKLLGDMDKFFDISKGIFKFAYTPKDVGRCYRNLAFYFVEKKLWSEAIGCNLLSMEFDRDTPNAPSELYYIQQVTQGSVKKPSTVEMQAYSEKYGFPLGADNDVLGIAFTYGKHFLEDNQPDAAKYFLSIVYDLTKDKEIKSLIDQLPSGDNE